MISRLTPMLVVGALLFPGPAPLGAQNRPAASAAKGAGSTARMEGAVRDLPAAIDRIIPRIEGEVSLDGVPDEPAWEGVEPLPAEMHVPEYGAEPSQRTEFRVAHDGESLFFSCSNYDTNPELIQDFSLERDQVGWDSDNCGIHLDSANDEENSLVFITWPSGNRTDFALTNDAQGRFNTNWNTFWDVAVAQTDRGWFAEFRIPFSSLLFEADDDRVVMGLATMRNFARNNERISYPNASPGFGLFSFARPSRMGKVVFEGGVEPETPVYLTPYGLGGTGHSHALNPDETEFIGESRETAEVGLDLKYGVTSNLTLDLSYNTDFAQVEADDQVVNLTRFSLFFPEKRRFFQERAANFEYSLGGQERLFHTRRVGLARGEAVPIYGGARLVGRVGEWDVGFLDMQTEASEALPSENQGVLRLRRRILNANSYIGVMVTSRLGSGRRYNLVYGTDGLFRVGNNDYVTLNWSQSFDHEEEIDSEGAIGPVDRALMRLNWERRGADDLSYLLELTHAGDVFEPGMGFLRRRDFTKGKAGVGYGWRPGPGSTLLTYSLRFDGTVFARNEDRSIETGELMFTGEAETKLAHRFTVAVPVRYENIRQPFTLSDETYVPEGTYRFALVRLQYRAPQRFSFRPGATLEGGRFFDGRQLSFSVDPTWAPSRHFRLEGTYRLDHVEFPSRGQSFTAHIGRLRTETMYSSTTSFLGFVQYNSADQSVILNLRLRYNPSEGNDLYLVWNEGLVTDRFRLDPAPPLSDRRSLMVKYSHTFDLGF